MAKKEYALIVAGGKGTRMKSSLPKQFILLAGKPIILHTLEKFYSYSRKITVILVLPKNDFATWNRICRKYKFREAVILQEGGATRFQSVRNGLDKIEGQGLVAIHDGVRPLVAKKLIASSFRAAALHQCAVAGVLLKESIRMTDHSKTVAVDRRRFRMIQTPQTFDVQLIKDAYSAQEDPALTDDASVVEKAGHKIFLFEGSYRNIKITTPEDLVMAEALMKGKFS